MSKRWKTRQRNAAKQERSRNVLHAFYNAVAKEIERIQAMSPETRDRLLQQATKEGKR